MAESGGGKSRADVPTLSLPTRPVPMQLFATWEVERTSPNCVPRLCVLKLTRLEVSKLLEPNLTEVVISVSMQSSRKILRSNEITVRPSGLIDAELDLSFSLQYPHFLKRAGNNLRVMLQRRKKYKTRTILGFKTLAVGLVNMGHVLQCSVDNQLKLFMKGSSAPVAQVTVSSLTSQPVEADTERMNGSANRSADDRGEGDENSSDEDDDFSMSEASDSGGDPDILDDERRRRGKMTIPDKHQKNFKQKFIALLKKFKVADEELVDDMSNYPDISPPENEANDDFMFPDYLEDLDSDAENELLEDTISIISTPKPSLRPFFDLRKSNENVRSRALVDDEYEAHTSVAQGAESEDVSTEPESLKDTLSPPSDVDMLSDSTPASDSVVSESTAVRRSVSLRERRKNSETLSEGGHRRRKSDEVQLPTCSLSDQLSNVLPLDDEIPDSILLVSTAEWQGQLLALRLWDKDIKMICARTNADTQAVFVAIVNKYQKFCNTHSDSPPHLRVAIAGTEGFISAVLQPYVEQFSSKPPDWQTFLTFLPIPLGSQPLAKYIAAMDSTYNSLFMDNFWKEAFEHSDSTLDIDEVERRVDKFMSATTLTHNLPIAEALINTKYKGSDEGSSQVFVPFVCDVRIGSTDGLQDYEATVTSGTPTNAASVNATGGTRGEFQGPSPGSSPLLQSPFISPIQNANSLSAELLELQVDYWLMAGNKKEAVTKSSLKTTFRSLVVTRLPSSEDSSALSVTAVTKERKRGPKLEAMMRSMKKSKEKDAESKNQPVVASVSKLVCTTKAQSSTLNVVIDGVTWSEVKFFSLSSQWPTHIKNFPIGIFSRAETSC